MAGPAQSDAARRADAMEKVPASAVVCVPTEEPSTPAVPAPADRALQRCIHELVCEHMDFVWRSLRRLGVGEADCDDGCQRVWLVVASKARSIEPGKAKSFIFSVVMRVAADMRRSQRRHQPVEFDERRLPPGASSGVIDTEALLEQQRGWQLLDELLASLSWELRTVFVMFEIEGLSSVEIADVLGLPRGTVASRLRLAREAFQRGVERHKARIRCAEQLHASVAGRRRWWLV